MSNAPQLVADVASDIETWERRIHPFVRHLERLVVAPELLAGQEQPAALSSEPDAASDSLIEAYAALGRAWAALPLLWFDPAALPRVWQAYGAWAEASTRAWLPGVPESARAR